jgi:hypothetical protein
MVDRTGGIDTGSMAVGTTVDLCLDVWPYWGMVAGCACRATGIARVKFHASFNTGRAERDPTMPRCGQSTRGRSSSTILIGPGRDSPCSRQFRAKNCQGTLCVGRVVSRATKTCPTGLQHSQFRIAGCAVPCNVTLREPHPLLVISFMRLGVCGKTNHT